MEIATSKYATQATLRTGRKKVVLSIVYATKPNWHKDMLVAIKPRRK